MSPHYGATEGTRTPDLLITNQLLYQLSHSSIFDSSPKGDEQNLLFSIADFARFVKSYFTRNARKRHSFPSTAIMPWGLLES